MPIKMSKNAAYQDGDALDLTRLVLAAGNLGVKAVQDIGHIEFRAVLRNTLDSD